MPTTKTFSVADGVAFASALKVSTDNSDKLIDLTVDPIAKTADCTFETGTGPGTKPAGAFTTYSVSNGTAFAGVLKVHTDFGQKIIWIVVNSAAKQAECWFE